MLIVSSLPRSTGGEAGEGGAEAHRGVSYENGGRLLPSCCSSAPRATCDGQWHTQSKGRAEAAAARAGRRCARQARQRLVVVAQATSLGDFLVE